LPPVQRGTPPPFNESVGKVIARLSFRHTMAMVCIERMVPCAAAWRARARDELRDAKTTDERIPIIAITTKSSIRVKPRL
jgi:hypothetical protein